MFTALTLSMALGAPVPAPAAPVATGTAPRVMEVKPDANGKITVTVTRTEMQKVQVGVGGAVNPGAKPAVAVREVPVTKTAVVELGEVKDLAITTADGKKVETDEAMKKLAGGAVVIVSADGKPVSPAFLKVFKDDTLVLASPELTAPQGPAIGRPIGGVRPLPQPLPAVPGGVQILPIQPGNVQVIPANGGVIQIQVGGAGGGAAPAILPVAPPEPAEKLPPKNEK